MAHPRRGRKHLIAMVGLPARGKTFTARKLTGYLGWLGYPTRSFNVGEARRRQLGPGQEADFFDPANRAAAKRRAELSDGVLRDAVTWLREEGRIAIFDATNGEPARRAEIRRICAEEDFDLLFVELQMSDPDEILANVREAKVSSPDYVGVDPEAAVQDFFERIEHYDGVYRPLRRDEGAWLRMVDRGRRVEINEVYGWIPGRIVLFLSNLQITERPVWLTRHGESEFNEADRIGGDSSLTARGHAYAGVLADHVRGNFSEDDELDVWSSTMHRTIETARPLGIEPGAWRALDEIDAGAFDGLTYSEIATAYPAEFEARARDKYRYRYPRGESYADVVQRLDRVIVELESYRTPVLVIAHRAVLRALYAYFLQLPLDEAPHVDMPLHTIIKLTPTAYGCREERVQLEPPEAA